MIINQLDILGWTVFVLGAVLCIVGRMFSSISGLYPPDASRIPEVYEKFRWVSHRGQLASGSHHAITLCNVQNKRKIILPIFGLWPPPTWAEVEVTGLHPDYRTRSDNIWTVPSIYAKDPSNQVSLMGKIFDILQKKTQRVPIHPFHTNHCYSQMHRWKSSYKKRKWSPEKSLSCFPHIGIWEGAPGQALHSPHPGAETSAHQRSCGLGAFAFHSLSLPLPIISKVLFPTHTPPHPSLWSFAYKNADLELLLIYVSLGIFLGALGLEIAKHCSKRFRCIYHKALERVKLEEKAALHENIHTH